MSDAFKRLSIPSTWNGCMCCFCYTHPPRKERSKRSRARLKEQDRRNIPNDEA